MSEIPYMMENTPAEFERVRDLAWPAPPLSEAEARVVAAFDAAPTPPEVTEAAVLEEVARAMHDAVCESGCGWGVTREHRAMAAAAVAAYRATNGGEQ